MEKLYSTKEVAIICKVNVETVWRWYRENKLKYVKVGRKKMVKESDFNEFVDGDRNDNK